MASSAAQKSLCLTVARGTWIGAMRAYSGNLMPDHLGGVASFTQWTFLVGHDNDDDDDDDEDVTMKRRTTTMTNTTMPKRSTTAVINE
eukprot:10723279-Karenia_brevis.AAC.1